MMKTLWSLATIATLTIVVAACIPVEQPNYLTPYDGGPMKWSYTNSYSPYGSYYHTNSPYTTYYNPSVYPNYYGGAGLSNVRPYR